MLACGTAFGEFALEPASIPIAEILSGGPGKDGIPAILEPNFVAVEAVTFPKADDRVAGLGLGSAARAYPLPILNWHEAVNDRIDGIPVLVTYCPLTGSVVAFDRRVDTETLTFGVSGRLYQSNVLLYDHQSMSLWSQLAARAVTGPRSPTALRRIPIEVTTWGDWRLRNPEGRVLSLDTGHVRDYGRDPYATYATSPRIMFPIAHTDARRAPKDWVLGVQVGEHRRAYALADLPADKEFADTLGGRQFAITVDRHNRSAGLRATDGDTAPVVVIAYWFAWAAFHPGTDLYKPIGSKEDTSR